MFDVDDYENREFEALLAITRQHNVYDNSSENDDIEELNHIFNINLKF